MNDIYWQEKRTMTSKQFSSSSSSSSIQSRPLYENTFQTTRYQPIDSRSTTGQLTNSPYFRYSPVINRSYNNISLPYASSAYGVYRRVPPNRKGPPSIHPNLNRRIDLRTRSYSSQQHQLSHNVSDDYDYSKYEELNGLISAIYGDEQENHDDDDNEKNRSDFFNYTFPTTGVSFIENIT
jgi:hypothetical protein